MGSMGYVFTAAMGFIWGGLILDSDIGMNIPKETRAASRQGALSMEQSCEAQAEFSEKLNAYFMKRAKKGSENPSFVITKEDCISLMNRNIAAPET